MALRARRRRKRMSMTSLIDVIFLLLLFFMLSSTFSRFAEVELQAGSVGGVAGSDQGQTLFLRVTEQGLSLNGQSLTRETLAEAIRRSDGAKTLLVSVSDGASAQSLTDVLVALRPIAGLNISVLEAL